jgi:hypothetical protein
MKVMTGLWIAGTTLALAAIAVMASDSGPSTDQAGLVHNGRVGFIVTDFAFALSKDASETGACPHGWTLGLREQYAATPDGQRHDGESDQDFARRLAAGTQKLATAPNGQNLCMNPEAGTADPHWRTVDVPNIPAYGIDLDDQDSRANGKPAPGTCAHDDFRGFNGERGIDNQFFRVVGCSRSYQPGGQSWDNTIELRTGSWGVLITLEGVNDIRNAPNVQVGIYASADPIQLSPTREPVTYATYSPMQDPRFRATTRGRIVNGVLTTDPVDVRFYKVTNGMYIERPLRHARLHVTISDSGVLEGYLAGYAPVEAIYDHQYGYRDATDGHGNPSPLRLRSGSANGNAFVNNHTCNGAYHALLAAADGDRDPATGRCTSISTQYRIRAVPAFVVDSATTSVNNELDRGSAKSVEGQYLNSNPNSAERK